MKPTHALFLAVGVVVAAVVAPAVAQAPAQPFRIALVADGLAEGCAVPAAGPAKAYTDHLAGRLEQSVQLCAKPTIAAAAAALAAGDVEAAVLDPAAFGTIRTAGRPILAPRFTVETGRVLSVALTAKSANRTTLASLKGARPVFASDAPSGREVPLQALADHGVDVGGLGPAKVAATVQDAAASLRAGQADVLIVHAGARQRLCRPDDDTADLCADLVEVVRGRPTAPLAMTVRSDMPVDLRYRLVGIHIALHIEQPEAMAFIADVMPGAISLDPTEPTALQRGAR